VKRGREVVATVAVTLAGLAVILAVLGLTALTNPVP
jgi:hypothetical protein